MILGLLAAHFKDNSGKPFRQEQSPKRMFFFNQGVVPYLSFKAKKHNILCWWAFPSLHLSGYSFMGKPNDP